MSLIIWLPLNGKLKNQGVTDVNVTVNGTTSYTDGKIGSQALSCNGSSFWAIANITLGAEVSVACWTKTSANGRMSWVLESDASAILNLYESNYYTLNTGDGNNNLFKNSSGNSIAVLHDNIWHHFVVTFGNNEAKLYIDGTYVGKAITFRNPTTTNKRIKLGGGYNNTHSYDWNGQLNDFRVYDHCLSLKEIKLLAQGLICHYPLNHEGYGNDNILLNTHFDSRSSQTTGWNTTKNGTLIANYWGGYNSGVINQASVYHAHLKEFEGEYVYEYIKTNDESWLGISQGGLQSKLVAGNTYTFSWEEYHVNGTNRVGTGLYYFTSGASSANFHLGIQQESDKTREIGKWQKYSYTFIAPSDMDTSKNASWYVYGHYNGNGTFYFRHPKLEEGSEATPWYPNSTDSLYTALGFDQNIVYDTSGYCNNGIANGTLTFSNNTPRYNLSTYFGSGNNYIDVGSTSILPKEEITVSLWIKFTNWYQPMSCTEGGGWNFENGSSGIRFSVYISGVGYKYTDSDVPPATLSDGKWHLLTGTVDIDNVKFYIDGVLKTTTAKGSTNGIGYANNHLFIGAEAGSGTSIASAAYIGNISDVRIYCTALSAEDIAELYSVGASIDNAGNTYAMQFQEV